MWKTLKRMWRYLGSALGFKFNELADARIQLEQALAEAQDQHRRLKEQAANVIANQKTTETRLNARLEELEKLNRNAQQALIMADEAGRNGDEAKATEYTNAAEAFANHLIALEREVEELKALALAATQASDQAKTAVQQNSRVLQQKLAEKQRLLSQLDQAKMQEQMNVVMRDLNETVGEDVPTLAEVREKIEGRYAKAKGMAELQDMSVESKMLEIEQATINVDAQARLSEIRSRLGIAEAPTGEPATASSSDNGATSTATEPATN